MQAVVVPEIVHTALRALAVVFAAATLRFGDV